MSFIENSIIAGFVEKQNEAKLGRGATKQRRAKFTLLTGIKRPR
jgi:hypothetical protein